jgi:hypothetical protein
VVGQATSDLANTVVRARLLVRGTHVGDDIERPLMGCRATRAMSHRSVLSRGLPIKIIRLLRNSAQARAPCGVVAR